MAHIFKDLLHRAALHDLPRIHHIQSGTELSHHAQIVGNHHNSSPFFLLKLLHQMKNLGFNGHVQSRGGFIRNHQFGIAHHGHGDHHSLSQSSGKLMGILPISLRRIGNSYHLKNSDNPLPRFFLGQTLVVKT